MFLERLEERLSFHAGTHHESAIYGLVYDDPSGTYPVAEIGDGSSLAESVTVPVGPAWTTGNKTVLYIRVRFADDAPTFEPQSESSVASVMTQANNFFVANSFGATSLAATITPVFTLPKTKAEYIALDGQSADGGSFALRSDALALAAAYTPDSGATHPYDYLNYDLDAIRFTGGPGFYGGLGYIANRGVWLKSGDAGTAIHEFGHNFGLFHANYWQPTADETVLGPGTVNEYGNPADTMGNSGSLGHFNAYEKNKLGWLPTANVIDATASGTYTIHAHDTGTFDSDRMYAVKVHRNGLADYWLDFRRLTNGVSLHWSSPTSGTLGTRLLDVTSSTPTSEHVLEVGRTFHDPVYNVYFTPVFRTNSSPDNSYLEVHVEFGTPAGNVAPAVAINADAEIVSVGQAVNFTATAADGDGDELAYYWQYEDRTSTTAANTVSSSLSNAPTLTKTWNVAGEYRVQLTVSDRHGGTSTVSKLVRIGSPPSTEALIRGRVVDSLGSPVSQAIVTSGSRVVYTDDDGYYALTNADPGSYTVAVAKAGWTFSAPASVTVANATDNDVNGIDFQGTDLAYVVAGFARDGAVAMAGVVVSDGRSTTTTAADGSYSLATTAGIRTLTASVAGYRFSSQQVVVNYANAVQNFQPLPVAFGGDARVNVTTAGAQSKPDIAADASGNYVVAWASAGQDGSGTGVYARRYSATGAPLAGEWLVNAGQTAGNQDNPAVAMDAQGNFVVVWENQNGLDGSGFGIYAQRYDKNGNAVGGQTTAVNTVTSGNQFDADVAMAADGRYVVTWTSGAAGSTTVYAQRFDAAGAKQGSAISVGSFTGDDHRSQVTIDDSGNFIVTWTYAVAAETIILFRRYDSAGTLQGTYTFASARLASDQEFVHAVAADASGNFTLVWTQKPQFEQYRTINQYSAGDGSGYGIFAQRYDASGVAVGSLLEVNQYTAADQRAPAIDTDPSGGFTVVWQSANQDGSANGVYARRFDASGIALGNEFLVASTTADDQSNPVIVASAGGAAIVAWQSFNQDGADYGVYTRRFGANEAPLSSGLSAVNVDEDSPTTIRQLFAAFSDSTDSDDALTYAIAANSNTSLFASVAINPLTGELALDYAENAFGTASITVRATDTSNAWVETSFVVTVAPVNDAPTIEINTGASLDEGGTIVVAASMLRVADIESTAAQLTYTLTASPANGSWRKNGASLAAGQTFTQADIDSGAVRYVHDGGETTSDGVTFTVADGSGGSIGATTFGVTVNPRNDAPVAAANLGLTLDEGATATIAAARLRTSDADNATAQLVYTIGNAPTRGELRLNGVALTAGGAFSQADLDSSRVTYAHDGGESTTDSFTFVVGDGTVALPSAEFSIVVQAVNDAPILSINGGLSVDEGAAAVIGSSRLRVDDVDNTAAQLVFTVVNTTTNGNVRKNGLALSAGQSFTQADINAGAMTYLHDGGESTSDALTFSVADGVQGQIANATFLFTVIPVNDAPSTITNLGLTLDEGASATIAAARLQTSDADNATAQLIYTIGNAPTRGELRLNGVALAAGEKFTQADLDSSRVAYAHDGGESTTDEFAFTVTDGLATLASAHFAIVVQPVNDAPTLWVHVAAHVDEGASAAIGSSQLQVIDVDDSQSQLAFTVVSATTNGVLHKNGTTLAAGQSFTQADIDAGLVEYVHDGGESTSDAFLFAVADAHGLGIGNTIFAIVVRPQNDAPVAEINAGLNLDEGATAIVAASMLRATDDDNAPAQLVFTMSSATANGVVRLNGAALIAGDSFTQADIDAGRLTYVHDGGESTSDGFEFTVSDGVAALAAARFNIAVRPVNDPPTFLDHAFIVYGKSKAGTLVGRLRATDAEADQSLSYAIVGGNGAFNVAADGAITVADPKKLVGTTLNLTVRASDDGVESRSDDAMVTVQLRPANTAPAFTLTDALGQIVPIKSGKATLTIDENAPGGRSQVGAVIGTVSVADFDEPETVLALVHADTPGFHFDPSTGRITIENPAGFDFERPPRISLVFTATDHGLTGLPAAVTGTLTITMEFADVNEAPVFSAAAASFNFDENKAGKSVATVVAKDVDKTAPNKTLAYSLVSQRDESGQNVSFFAIDPARGTLKLPSTTTLDYEASRFYSIVVRATDGGGLFSEQTLTVNVVDLNEAPAATWLDANRLETQQLAVARNLASGAVLGHLRTRDPDVFRNESLTLTPTTALGGALKFTVVEAGLYAIVVDDPVKWNATAKVGGTLSLAASVKDSGFTNNVGKKMSAKSTRAVLTMVVGD